MRTSTLLSFALPSLFFLVTACSASSNSDSEALSLSRDSVAMVEETVPSADPDSDPALEMSESRVGTVPPGCRGSIRLNCRGAILRGYDFRDVSLRFADFWGADLTGARFDSASLITTSFMEAKLSGASFTGADLSRSVFTRANVRGADFRNANLTYALVDQAEAQGANFTGAKFESTSLRYTNLTDAIWTNGRPCIGPPYHQSIGFCYQN